MSVLLLEKWAAQNVGVILIANKSFGAGAESGCRLGQDWALIGVYFTGVSEKITAVVFNSICSSLSVVGDGVRLNLHFAGRLSGQSVFRVT